MSTASWSASLPQAALAAGEAGAPIAGLVAEVFRGVAALDDLRADWVRLAALSPAASVFQARDILAVWASHFLDAGAAGRLATLVVREAGRPVLLWPLVVETRGFVRIARSAGNPVGHYDEILTDPRADVPAAVAAALACLAGDLGADLLHLPRLRADSPLAVALAEKAAPLGETEGAPFSDIAGDGFEAFLKTLKPRVAKQHRKRQRQIAEAGVAVACSAETASAWFEEALALKQAWLTSTGRVSHAFMDARTRACLAGMAATLSVPGPSPRIVTTRLTLDGRTAAIETGFVDRSTYHLYLAAFAPEFARFGPGHILTEHTMRWCAGNGISRYDWLAPRGRNKAEWQTGETLVREHALPLSRLGRAYVAGILGTVRPNLRRLFYTLPGRIRSRIAARALRI